MQIKVEKKPTINTAKKKTSTSKAANTGKLEGSLSLNYASTVPDIAKLHNMLEEHQDSSTYTGWFNLKLNTDMTSLEGDGSASKDIKEQIEHLIKEMTSDFPEFLLEGEFIIRDPRNEAASKIVVKKNKVTTKVLNPDKLSTKCPHCSEPIKSKDLGI